MNNCVNKKALHLAVTAFISFYLLLVFLIRPLVNTLLARQETFHPFLSLIICLSFFAFCFFLLHYVSRNIKSIFTHRLAKSDFSRPLFWGVSVVIFLFYLLYLLSDYPGGFSPDTLWQWEQAHTLEFNDHHPFFHTLLFWLFIQIWDSYTFLLLVQIAALSFGFGYLAATMYAWGFRLSLILVICSASALCLATRNIAMFYWKDTALSIFLLFFLSHIFHIVLTKGEWLKKTQNRLASSILLACITLVRHNAVLLTAPLLVLLLLSYPGIRRTGLKLLATVLVLIIGVKYPLQTLCNVEPATSTYLETTGLPMTIMCSAYALAPEAMPPEAYQFMNAIAPQDEFAQTYEFGNFNSVKWAFGSIEAPLSAIPLPEFLRMVWKTVCNDPILALRSVLDLTAMVWDPSGEYYSMSTFPYGEPAVYLPVPASVQNFFEEGFQLIDSAFNGVVFQKFSSQLGILVLVLILALYLSVHNFHGWSVLWLVLPVLCYNFGTMLLLCGPDYRFFHFNCLITWPLVVLLLSKPQEIQSETCK